MPAIVYVARPDGTIAFANAAWERFSGLPVQTVLDHGWADVVHAGDAARVGGAWLGAMASLVPFREEFRIRDRAGEFRWVISHAIPTLDAGGACVGMVRHRHPDRRAPHRGGRARVARGRDPAARVDERRGGQRDPRQPPLDRVHRRWASTSRSGAAGRACCIRTTCPRWSKAGATRCVTGTFSSERAYRLRRHDGVYRWFVVRAVAVRDENGAILRWYGTNTDVDDQYRAAQRRTMLDRLGIAFTESLDYERTARTVVSAMCEDFADFAFVDVVEDGRLQRIAVESGRLGGEAGTVSHLRAAARSRPPSDQPGAAHRPNADRAGVRRRMAARDDVERRALRVRAHAADGVDRVRSDDRRRRARSAC